MPPRSRFLRTVNQRAYRFVALLVALAISVLLFVAVPASAQQFPFQYYPPSDLPQASVQVVFQDAEGFLWVGTQDGAARYDGHRFHHYGLDDGLRSGLINDITQGVDGLLWFAEDEGLAVFDGERFRSLGADRGLPGQHGVQLAPRADGSVVVGTSAPAGVGIARLEGSSITVETVPLPEGVRAIVDIAVGADGRTFVGTDGKGLLVLDKQGAMLEGMGSGLGGDRAGPLLVDGKAVYIATNWGLTRLIGDELVTFRDLVALDVRGLARRGDGPLYLSSHQGSLHRVGDPLAASPSAEDAGQGPSEPLTSLVVDPRGTVWGVSLSNGITRFDEAKGEVAVIGQDRGILTNHIYTLMLDREDNLWVGSGVGLHRLQRGPFINHLRQDGLSDETIWSIRRTKPGGDLLVGTHASLDLYDGVAWRAIHDEEVRSVVVLDESRFMVANRRGLVLIDMSTGEPKRTWYDDVPGLPSQTGAVAMVLDEKGRVVVATEGGVSRMQGEAFVPLDLPASKGPERIWSLAIGKGGRIWCAGDLGLILLDGKTSHRFTTADGLRDNAILSLTEADDGVLWFSYDSSRGVGALDMRKTQGNRLRHLDHTDGLPSDYVFFVADDRAGNVWFGSSRGLARWDGKAIRPYTIADGLAWNDSDLNAWFEDYDDTLWFGTSRGLSHYLPELDVHPSPPKPTVVVTRATLGGEVQPSGSTVPWESRDLEIEFAALSYVEEEATEYRYRLLNYTDDSWSDFTSRNWAVFTNLPATSYKLEIQARVRGTVVSETVAYAFTVQAGAGGSSGGLPWWLSVIAGIVGIGVGYGIRELLGSQ